MKKIFTLPSPFRRTIKLLIVMKILFLTCVVQILAVSGYAQVKHFQLKMQDARVEDVLNKIEDETEFYFFYKSNELANLGTVNVEYANATIYDVLNDLLKNSSLSYKVIDRYIAITPSTMIPDNSTTKLLEKRIVQQQKTISGVVVDDNNEPLIGVTVIVKGTTNGVITDINGRYSITVLPDDVLQYSFIGYQTMEEPVGDRSVINVSMRISIEELEEVVVTGYQAISKERSSGSFSYIDATDIEKRPALNLASSMDGMFAGLRVYDEGGSTRLSVRGIGTMTMGIADPLIVVDGFPVEDGLSSINPDDVQSVHVLKDAAAASIWGARSSNGVVVITTKKARAGLHVNVNSYVSMQDKMDLAFANPIASSADALAWERYLWENDQVFSSFSLSSNVDGNNNPATFGITLLNLRDLGRISQAEFDQQWSALEQTDYSKDVYEYLLRNPVTQNYNISISGASERNQFVFNTRYADEMDDFMYNSNRSLLTNFRNTYKVTKWLDLNISLMSKFVRRNNSGASLSDIKSISPYETLVDENGDYSVMVGAHYQEFIDSVAGVFPRDWNYNLLQEIRSRKLESEQNSIRFQTGLVFKLLEGLNYETKFQFEQYKTENSSFYSEDSYYVRDQLNKWVDYDEPNREILQMYVPEGGQLMQSYGTTEAINFSNQLKFDRTFGRHQVTTGLYTELSSKISQAYSAPTVYGYDPDLLTSEVPEVYFPIHSYWGGNNYQMSGMNSSLSYLNDRFFSMLGNLAYTYEDKYSVTGSFRIDASNLIVEDPKYRYSPFWSVGGNWKLDREPFLQNVDAISRLNLRLSYGHTGNVVLSTSVVPLIAMYGVYPLTGAEYGRIVNYGNPTLTWERTKTTNLGVDYSFFRNRIYGSLEIYNKHGEDIVGSVDLPRLTGTTVQEFNTAEILNRGFELNINTTLPLTSNISWLSTLNFAYNKSKVLSLQILNHDYYSLRVPHFEEGKPVDAIYSYKYLGMNQDNVPYLQGIGDNTWTFHEVPPTTTDDREYMVYSGSAQPTTIVGWQNGISAYGFTLYAIIDGEFGHVFRRPTFDYAILANSKSSSLLHSDVSGVLDNTATDIPTMPEDDENNLSAWGGYATFLNTTIEDASNIRFKEINLSYDLPAKLFTAVGFNNARVYFQIRNVGLLWTANEQGLDPMYIYSSRSSSSGGPVTLVKPARSYTFGINFGF